MARRHKLDEPCNRLGNDHNGRAYIVAARQTIPSQSADVISLRPLTSSQAMAGAAAVIMRAGAPRGALAVFASVRSFGPTCYASRARIAQGAALGERWTRRMLDELVRIGVLDERERAGQTTIYTIGAAVQDALFNTDAACTPTNTEGGACQTPRGLQAPRSEVELGQELCADAPVQHLTAAPALRPAADLAGARAHTHERPREPGPTMQFVAAWTEARQRAGRPRPNPALLRQAGSIAKRCLRDGVELDALLAAVPVLIAHEWTPARLPAALDIVAGGVSSTALSPAQIVERDRWRRIAVAFGEEPAS